VKYKVAEIFFDPDAPEYQEWTVEITEFAREFLSAMTDFELKIVAAEAGIHVRKTIEMPPSPKTT
jgi:hypothetical protein